MEKYRYMNGIGITGLQLLNSECPVCNELIDTNEVRQKLIVENMSLVRTARRKGYISRRMSGVIMCYYNGRFGEGYTVFQSAEDSSRYVKVSYYVSRETYERRSGNENE